MADPKKLDIDNFTIPAPVAKRETLNIDEMSSGQTPDRKMLDNAPATDDWLTSTAKAVPTTIIKGLSHVPGMFGDAIEGGKYLGQRAAGFITGRTPEQQDARRAAYDKRFAEESPLLAKALSVIPSAERWVPSGHDISSKIAKTTGEYEPTSTAGRYAMDAAEAGISMIAPGGGIKAGITKRAPGVGSAAPKLTGFATDKSVDLAKTVLKEGASPKMIGVGTVGGGAASAATDLTGDPLYGMAAAPIASGAAVIAGKSAATRFPSVFESSRQDKAGKIFKENVGDVDRALASDAPNPLGTRMTTAEAFGDTKLAKAEMELEARDKGFAADTHAIRGEQQAARQAYLQTLADPQANPKAIADAYIQQLNDLHVRLAQETADAQAASARTRDSTIQGANTRHDQTQASLEAGVATARQGVENNQLPTGIDRSARGDAARDIANTRDSTLGREVTRLYEAVDPDGNLNVVAENAANGARLMLDKFRPGFEVETAAKPIVDMVAAMPPVVAFNDLVLLDQTITAKMADFKNSDRPAHGQLVRLKGLVQADLRNSLENQMAWQERAVEAGTMRREDTIGAQIARDAQEYMANARASSRANAGNDASVGAPRVPDQAGSEGANGPGVRTGDAGVPNFTPADLERLNAAKQRHIERATTFQEGPVGDALKENGYGRYTKPGSRVAANIFKRGAEGAENLNAWLRATGDHPEALQIVQDIASASLVDAAKDGLTPQRLAAWKRDHAPALARIDEVVSGFSDRFDNVATAVQALDDASRAQTTGVRQAGRDRDAAIADANRDHTRTVAGTVKDEAAKVRDFESNAGAFLKLDNAQDIVGAVGSILGAKDSATRMGRIIDDLAGDPAGLEGLKRGAATWMIDKFSNIGISDSGARNVSPKLSPFISQRETTLRRLYGDEGYKTLTDLATDIDRGTQHAGRKADHVGPNTAAKLSSMLDDMTKGNIDNMTWTAFFMPTIGHALFSGNWASILGATGLVLDKTAGSAMRTSAQTRVTRILAEAMADPEKGKLLLQRAVDNEGKPNIAVLAPLLSSLRAEQPDDDRAKERFKPGNWPASGEGLTIDMKRRAAGGRIGAIDHEAEAARYVRLAARAKTLHGKKTKSFLKVPDATVAKALAVAHEAI